MRKIAATLLITTALTSPAYSMVECTSQKGMDRRICNVLYRPGQVTHVYVPLRSLVIFQFSDEETNPRILAADSTSIISGQDGNLFWIKPKEIVWESQSISINTTNTKTGQVIPHIIQLDVYEGKSKEEDAVNQSPDKKRPEFMVHYSYPPDPAELRRKAQARAEAREAKRAAAQLSMAVTVPAQNCNYVEQHDPAHPLPFIPVSVCDDGQTTTLSFPGNMPVPAITVAGADGKETTTMQSDGPSHTGDVILHGVYPHLWLRYGDALDCIFHIGPINQIGYSTGTGTSSPFVQRVLKAPK